MFVIISGIRKSHSIISWKNQAIELIFEECRDIICCILKCTVSIQQTSFPRYQTRYKRALMGFCNLKIYSGISAETKYTARRFQSIIFIWVLKHCTITIGSTYRPCSQIFFSIFTSTARAWNKEKEDLRRRFLFTLLMINNKPLIYKTN